MLLLVLTFAFTVVPTAMGYKTLIVTGGSMQPVIHPGDAVIIKPAPVESYQENDLATFHNPAGGITTHRIVATKVVNGETFFQTKGDVNVEPDPDLTPAGAVVGKVSLDIPKLGYVLNVLEKPLVKLALLAFPILVLLAGELTDLTRPRKKGAASDSVVGIHGIEPPGQGRNV